MMVVRVSGRHSSLKSALKSLPVERLDESEFSKELCWSRKVSLLFFVWLSFLL